jgi:hypothetical protein
MQGLCVGASQRCMAYGLEHAGIRASYRALCKPLSCVLGLFLYMMMHMLFWRALTGAQQMQWGFRVLVGFGLIGSLISVLIARYMARHMQNLTMEKPNMVKDIKGFLKSWSVWGLRIFLCFFAAIGLLRMYNAYEDNIDHSMTVAIASGQKISSQDQVSFQAYVKKITQKKIKENRKIEALVNNLFGIKNK